jgi:heparin binding hemagglutinin HbhA
VIDMAVSLPTAADVRKAREQAAEQAELARTPLLAVLGLGDYAVATVSKAAVTARARAAQRREFVQTQVSELPNRVSTEELRKLVAGLREQAEATYEGFADRGEKAWGKISKQSQVKQAIATIGSYTEKLDARVDVLVDDAHDAAEKALTAVTRQTRSTGEKVAQRTQKFAAETAEAVSEAGEDAAATINSVGDEAAGVTRSVTRKAANRTAPKAAPKAATQKPATRRTTEEGS